MARKSAKSKPSSSLPPTITTTSSSSSAPSTASDNDQIIHPAIPSQLLPAYKLLTNTLAARRQTFNYRFIVHPIPLLSLPAIPYVLHLINRNTHVSTILLLTCGIVIALLSMLRGYSSPFLEEAEKMGKKSEYERRMKEDDGGVCVVAEWNEEVVGACTINAEGKVWGWGLIGRYRGKELGRGLLEEGIKEWRRKGGEVEKLVIDEESPVFFTIPNAPSWVNKQFENDKERAKLALKHAVDRVLKEE